MGRRVPAALALAVVVTLALAAGCTEDEPAPTGGTADDPLVTTTAYGDLRGSDRGLVSSWRGIPYAVPPVDDLRWLPPREAARWEGVRPAAEYGPACLQGPKNEMTETLFASIDETSEDCLTLNVHRPEDADPDLPVMVWIHGGSFSHGSGSQPIYNSSALVERGVVLVTVNYRLGRLGFFAHPALHSTGERYANFGLLDQVAALRWVRDNIGAFGGDPANVTIFGESAGGVSVNALMSAPEAAGLFANAITQSGLGREESRGWAAAQADGERVAGRLGLDDPTADELRSLEGEELMQTPTNILAGDAPILDDLLSRPVERTFAKGGEASVPYLVGTTDLELPDVVVGRMGADPAAARERILAKDRTAAIEAYGSEEELNRHVLSDAIFTEPARRLATLHSDRATTYRYRFAITSPMLADALGGAPHAAEIPYVFDATSGQRFSFEGSEELAAEISDLWVDFAQDGEVDGWSTADTGELVSFTGDGPVVGPDPWTTRLDAVEAGYDARAGRATPAR